MSYDVEVFSTQEPIAPASEEGRGWQIAVEGPLNVEPEDIPAQVRALLPGLRFLTQFHLEGDAPSSAQKRLLTMARSVARSARGVVVDQQQGAVETPRGVQRLEIEPEWKGMASEPSQRVWRRWIEMLTVSRASDESQIQPPKLEQHGRLRAVRQPTQASRKWWPTSDVEMLSRARKARPRAAREWAP